MITFECEKCQMFFLNRPFIVEACASVGMSNGKSTAEMLKIFMSAYHRKGHRR